jgi:chemotaxis protein methyltransferase CheR
MQVQAIRDEDIELILSDLLDNYRASLRRRFDRIFVLDKFPSFAEFRHKIKTDSHYLMRLVEELTVNVTEMFRDPHFYKNLREEVLPVLSTYPFIRIWHAGCSTGEEVYSMAIMLQEANLLHKSLLYATDINPGVLEKAKSGIFALSQMKQYSENYILSGGSKDFSNYYTANYSRAKFNEDLVKKIIFSTHNLVSDHSFNEFQLILCRNVLIYFDKDLQSRVLNLFDESLEKLGFLALGSKETLRFSAIDKRYRQLPDKEKIWRKIL